MQFLEILYFLIRGIAMLIQGAFALFVAGLRFIASAVMRREQLPCDLVVTTQSGERYSGVLRAGVVPEPGSSVGAVVPQPSAVDTSPTYNPLCECPDCTAVRLGIPSAGVARPDDVDDETWGH